MTIAFFITSTQIQCVCVLEALDTYHLQLFGEYQTPILQ